MIGDKLGLAGNTFSTSPALSGVSVIQEHLNKTMKILRQITATPPTDRGNITASGVAAGGQRHSSTVQPAADGVGGMRHHSLP